MNIVLVLFESLFVFSFITLNTILWTKRRQSVFYENSHECEIERDKKKRSKMHNMENSYG